MDALHDDEGEVTNCVSFVTNHESFRIPTQPEVIILVAELMEGGTQFEGIRTYYNSECDDSLVRLGQAVRQSDTVTSYTIVGVERTLVPVRVLVPPLENVRSLRALTLTGCVAPEWMAKCLIDALHRQTLESLNIIGSTIIGRDLTVLIASLGENHSLTCFRCGDCGCKLEIDGKALRVALGSNRTLRILEIRDCNDCSKWTMDLAKALCTNHTLQQINLSISR